MCVLQKGGGGGGKTSATKVLYFELKNFQPTFHDGVVGINCFKISGGKTNNRLVGKFRRAKEYLATIWVSKQKKWLHVSMILFPHSVN